MKDRIPAVGKAGRIKLTDAETGTVKYYFLELADDPTEAGTELSKANLLTDQTVQKLFGSVADKTINEAFAELGTSRVRTFNNKLYTCYPDTDHAFFSYTDEKYHAQATNPSYPPAFVVTKRCIALIVDGVIISYSRTTGEVIQTISVAGSGSYVFDCEGDRNGDIVRVIFYDGSSYTRKLVNVYNGASIGLNGNGYAILAQDDDNCYVIETNNHATIYKYNSTTLQQSATKSVTGSLWSGTNRWTIGTTHYNIVSVDPNPTTGSMKLEVTDLNNWNITSEYTIPFLDIANTFLIITWVDPSINRAYCRIGVYGGGVRLGYIDYQAHTLTILKSSFKYSTISYICHIDDTKVACTMSYVENNITYYGVVILDQNTGDIIWEISQSTFVGYNGDRKAISCETTYGSQFLKDKLSSDVNAFPIPKVYSNGGFIEINESTYNLANKYIMDNRTDAMANVFGVSVDGYFIIGCHHSSPSPSLYARILLQDQSMSQICYRPGYFKDARN